MGEFPLSLVTEDESKFFDNVGVIFVTAVTTAYPDIMRRIIPYLDGRALILFQASWAESGSVIDCCKRQVKRISHYWKPMLYLLAA